MSSKSEPVVMVDQLSKLFFRHKQYTLKEFFPAFLRGKSGSLPFWALKDVSFSVHKGEGFGIIGANGSGKSTLLKLLAGVTQKTSGDIQVKGRIAPLIELGAGFHPDLSGRENIFLNGIILGLQRKAIEDQFQSIVAFSELEDHIDEPVKHYSSGMYLRLAYAVAIHTRPDILLIDEILAVGDESFQKKCLDRIKLLQKKGVSLILISHDPQILLKFTQRAVLLEKGQALFMSDTKSVLARYALSSDSAGK